jgi:peptide/nickel transport system permease protein
MSTSKGEAYLDIVWRQFKKNRSALLALVILGPLFLLAIFAPVLASAQPFVFQDGPRRLFPWFRDLFNAEEAVDFFFNMALVGFFPWLVLALASNWFGCRRGVPGRVRLLWTAAEYAAILAALLVLFGVGALGLRPANRYAARSFAEEQFRHPDRMRGWYAPIPLGPLEQDIPARFQPPGFRNVDPLTRTSVHESFPHWLGTDDSGRDVLVRMIYGTRISLTVGFVAVGIYITLGIIVGAIAGYFGGAADMLISRVIEVMLVFPSFFLILTLVALLGPSIYIIMVVIGLTGWPSIARLIRGEVLKQRAMDYVTAARALGASHGRIIFRHILFNAMGPALVAAPFGIADAITAEAGLSLLGFGVRPPAPSWGAVLELGRDNYSYWWLIVVPSLAMFLTLTVFNLVGTGLRDAMDPRLRK